MIREANNRKRRDEAKEINALISADANRRKEREAAQAAKAQEKTAAKAAARKEEARKINQKVTTASSSWAATDATTNNALGRPALHHDDVIKWQVNMRSSQ
jgi:hypothetical protein